MTPHINPYFVTAALTIIVQGVYSIRWMYRKTRNAEIYRAFVKDMATNHLPHLYDADRKIVEGMNALLVLNGLQQIRLDTPPPISFVELNGNGTPR